MSAIGSLSTALATLRAHPVILVGGLFFVLLGELSVLLDVYLGSLTQLLVVPLWLFLTPFLLGGFVAMIHGALEGSTSVGTFVRGGKDNYVSMLGATVVFVGILIGLSIVGTVVLIIAGAAGFAVGGGIVVVALVSVVLLVGFAVVFMFVQFYDAAIVVSDDRAIDSFSRSVGLVSQNLASVIGFSVVFLALTLLGQGPGMALYLSSVEFTQTGETVVTSTSTLWLSIAVTLIVGTIVTAYAYTYFVAFYTSLLEGRRND
ncbi:DUF7847 domain-containing protein [Natrarchaeobaculum sulfurireducens]|uniref:DUF7847 domain-containing protein n=1 Tax=Natrarchaeobaculum sulfurireducens TaxID=2044521 RepID=UPI000E3EB7FA|nr:hypothetical protein [Natrarchaeobaculum sulfurireducens]